jgi:hypothetical protein
MKLVKNINAMFAGQNGSLGFKTGREYELRFTIFKNGPQLEIHSHALDQTVKYSSVIKFFDNWTNINTLE